MGVTSRGPAGNFGPVFLGRRLQYRDMRVSIGVPSSHPCVARNLV